MYFEIDFESPSDALIAPALHNAAGAPSEMNMTTIEDPLGRIRESAYIQWVLTRLKTGTRLERASHGVQRILAPAPPRVLRGIRAEDRDPSCHLPRVPGGAPQVCHRVPTRIPPPPPRRA